MSGKFIPEGWRFIPSHDKGGKAVPEYFENEETLERRYGDNPFRSMDYMELAKKACAQQFLIDNIHEMIRDELHKAMRNGATELSGILLGCNEYEALKQSIADNIYFKYPSLVPEGVLYNGLNVYQFVGSGIRVCTVHN